MLENVQNINKSHRVHHEIHEKLESGIIGWSKNSIRDENPKRYLLGKAPSLVTTIRCCNDATQLASKKVHRGLQIYKITRKD